MSNNFARADFQKTVGHHIRTARKRRRLTQNEVADELGYSRANYASIETGRIRVPADVVWRLAILLRVRYADLLPAKSAGSPT